MHHFSNWNICNIITSSDYDDLMLVYLDRFTFTATKINNVLRVWLDKVTNTSCVSGFELNIYSSYFVFNLIIVSLSRANCFGAKVYVSAILKCDNFTAKILQCKSFARFLFNVAQKRAIYFPFSNLDRERNLLKSLIVRSLSIAYIRSSHDYNYIN